jgi:molybdate-binding protein
MVAARFSREPVVLVEFAWRERGLIVAPETKGRLTGIADLRGRRLVPRQAAAGSQALLEQLLKKSGLGPDDLQLTAIARSESDAALEVLDGKADAAFGLMGIARQLRLAFVPIVRERFDLLVDRRAWFEPALQSLMAFCRCDAFVAKAEELEGYDVSGLGRVHFNGP